MARQQMQQIRMIGGKWRSRKLKFPAMAEIRPTPDRVRETLFNWLAPVIEGAYCLDLFTGSGALGFEALSRGAKHVVMVDKSPVVIEHLRATAALLGTHHLTLYEGKAPDNIILPPEPFDIVFLDPPFHHLLIPRSLAWLEAKKLIHADTLIYIEREKHKTAPALPPNINILKTGKTTQVVYYLAKVRI